MTGESDLRAAVAAGVLGSEGSYRSLLTSVVEVARAIFRARASSIFLLDEETDELVFEAVAGEGSDTLIGRRFPSSTGIAGWVVVTRQPLVLEDVSQDPRFARNVAEGTGYVPKGIMSAPLLFEERTLGVLQVLDRPQRAQFSLQEMDLLGLFANEAAIALDLLQRARRARAVLTENGDEAAVVARLAETADGLTGRARRDGFALLEDLERVLGRQIDA
jgi:GAF domain-containing protein